MQKTRKIEKVTGSQDDGFVRGSRNIRFVVRKTRKVEKVTSSQDDDFVVSGDAKIHHLLVALHELDDHVHKRRVEDVVVVRIIAGGTVTTQNGESFHRFFTGVIS